MSSTSTEHLPSQGENGEGANDHPWWMSCGTPFLKFPINASQAPPVRRADPAHEGIPVSERA